MIRRLLHLVSLRGGFAPLASIFLALALVGVPSIAAASAASVLLVWNGVGLVGRGLQPDINRDSLVAGTYIPGDDTTGPKWTGAFTSIYPSTPDGTIDINVAGTYRYIEYWGRVRPRVAGIKFEDCIFRGPNPAYVTTLRGCIQCYGTNPPHFEVLDCLFDPSGWPNFNSSRAVNEGSVWVVGIHGGNFTCRRTEIKWCQDAINYVGPSGGYDISMASHCLIEQNWIHKGFYINNWFGPADGQPHADGFQINTGRNIIIRGNMIGGTRVPAGYADTGRGIDGALGWGNGWNLGDDFWNAAIFLQQEVNNDLANKIEYVTIEKNFLKGGTMTLHWAYAAGFTNHWETLIVRDNFLFTRGTNWGNFSPTNGTGGDGFYANLSANNWNGNLYGQRYNNRNYETNELIPSANA